MLLFFFFFKQKTAYEMRISDWSSDVCSSDLADGDRQHRWNAERPVGARGAEGAVPDRLARRDVDRADAAIGRLLAQQAGEGQAPAGVDVDRIGRAGLRIARALGAADLAAGLVANRRRLAVAFAITVTVLVVEIQIGRAHV